MPCWPLPSRHEAVFPIQPELHHCLEKSNQNYITAWKRPNRPSSTAWKRPKEHHPLPGKDQHTIIHCLEKINRPSSTAWRRPTDHHPLPFFVIFSLPQVRSPHFPPIFTTILLPCLEASVICTQPVASSDI